MSSDDNESQDAFEAALRSGLAPDPALTVSEWADRHRVLSSRAASEAGPYRTARTPYMRAIMDALSPSNPARRVIFMKAAQVGATEGGNNWIGFCIHRAPGPFLAIQPTVDLAKRLSQQRIDPLIEESPALRETIMPSRSRDSGNTILSKRFPGGQLILTGANSAVGLRSMPARWVFMDEVDAYPGDVDGEGDPIALAEARTNSFGHRAKLFLASTPTVTGASRIEREYELSDQRRYHVPCPHCGALQWLQFARLRWDKGKPETAQYVCEQCDAPIEERFKTQMMAEEQGACWMPTADDETREKAQAAGTVGFHINGLYSPLGWLSWAEIARKWEEAKGNDAAFKTLKNTILGETWQEQGEAPDWQPIYERRERWAPGEVPKQGLFLTAGADVQKDRLEINVWAWGRGLESWLIEHIVIDGSPEYPETWAELSSLLGRTWQHENGATMQIGKLAIDTGYETAAVYRWARLQPISQVMPIKGLQGFNRSSPVTGPTFVDATEGGKRLRRGAKLWSIATAVFKSETYRFLRLPRITDEDVANGATPPPGTIHLPDWVDVEWIRQFTAEQLVTVKNKRGFAHLEWQKMRERNEAFDCRIYARAAAWVFGADRWPDAMWASLEAQVGITSEDAQDDAAPEVVAPPEPTAGVPRAKRRTRRAYTPSIMR